MSRNIAGVLAGRITKWVVVVFWIAVLAFAAPLAAKLTDVQQNDAISWLPGEAESTRALQQQEQFQSSDTIPAVVVYERTDGLTEDDLAKATADAQEFAAFDDLDGKVQGPLPSSDNQALQTVVPLDLGSEGWDRAPDFADDIRAIAEADGDMTVHISGPLGMASDSAAAFGGIDTTLLAATLAVVIVLLLLTYRSPVLWIFPLFTAVVALFTSQAVIYFLARDAGLVVNGQSAGILTVLVVGAGTDYALLLVARYREELRRHHDKHEAMAVALHRAGPAIFASAGTVILGMLCLVFADMNSTQGLGPVAAIGVGVALLAMVTLLPALLVIFGRWIFWPKRPAEGSAEPTASGFWARIGNRISTRPRSVWAVTAVILGVACIGVVRLDANGLSNNEQYTTTVDSVVGEEVLVEHGLADAGSPLAIVTADSSAEQVAQVAGGTDGIEGAEVIASNGGTTYIQAQLSDAPDSQAAFDTVERLRTALDAVTSDALVGGTTAINFDVRAASDRDNLVLIPVILVVVLLILMVLLRSVVAPLLLIATVVLSFGAALGVSALVFRYIFGFGGADTSFPLFVFVFLVALGIDYNIFLMTRVREESLKYGTRRGALIGLGATGGVITSAGLVLAGTFAVLPAARVLGRARLRRRLRRAARHDRGAGCARHGSEPRRRPPHVVAQRPRPQARRRVRRPARQRPGARRRLTSPRDSSDSERVF